MLCLQSESNPEWVKVASRHLENILIDHAHCEKKAAANGMSMIARYPDKDKLVREMIALIMEETEHFKFIFEELQKRGISLTRDKGDYYAQQLTQHIRKNEPERFLDFLLVDALIEARSCERFSLLSKCEDIAPDLRELYHSLLASEAGHYRTFTDIAREYFPADEVKKRLNELAAIEADIVRNLPNEPTMHG
jgi:tRNA-(ms[2]io[6]A)-hydroxylase